MGMGASENPSGRHSDGTITMGWIPYWNLLPLRYELERYYEGNINFKNGHPVSVNKWLRDGTVQIAPCSSVGLLNEPGQQMALPLGVTATGAVGSVYIGFHHEDTEPLQMIKARRQELQKIFKQVIGIYGTDVRRTAKAIWDGVGQIPAPNFGSLLPLSVTPNSATSAALARMFYRLWFGDKAFERQAAPSPGAPVARSLSERRPMELLIGDEALIKRNRYPVVIDLGEAWYELTGLPFVYAVWQQRHTVLRDPWRQRILVAAELAEAKMAVEPSSYFPDLAPTDTRGHAIDLGNYWRRIRYRLNSQNLKGLALFLALARHMDAEISEDEGAVARLMRCEALASFEL